MSYPERDRAGRGRYNPGFGAKLLSDLTGMRTRIVVQAFDYSRYRPTPGDLWTWSAQALRAGATDISFFASDNPRFTNRRLYDAMLDIARSRARHPAARRRRPTPSSSCSTRPRARARPSRTGTGDVRYRTSGDALYTTYALLGELGGGAFSFDADTRLAGPAGAAGRGADALDAARRHARRARSPTGSRTGCGPAAR